MKLIYLLLTISCLQALGQVNPGARLTALGTSGVALQDIWSVRKNQAGLSEITQVVAAVNYEQRFLEQDVSLQSAVIIFPKLKNVFALTVNRYGFDTYNEQQVSIACSRKWGDLSIGVGFNYHQLKIQSYGSSDAVSADVGFQYQLNKAVVLGAHISNPSKSSFNAEINGLVPVVMDFGTAYKLSDKVLVTSEIQKVLNSTMSFKLGTEYSIVKWLALRGGISTNPIRQYFGCGISHQKFRLDAATYNQYYLGFVPQVGLSYEF